MKWLWVAIVLLCRSTPSGWLRAQGADMTVLREATLVRAEIARSTAALRQYGWTEQTEVLVGGSVKSLDTFTCRYDADGKLLRTVLDNSKQIEAGRATSNRPTNRSKADLRDYIERSVSRIHEYAPPKPELIDQCCTTGRSPSGSRLTANPKFDSADIMWTGTPTFSHTIPNRSYYCAPTSGPVSEARRTRSPWKRFSKPSRTE